MSSVFTKSVHSLKVEEMKDLIMNASSLELEYMKRALTDLVNDSSGTEAKVKELLYWVVETLS